MLSPALSTRTRTQDTVAQRRRCFVVLTSLHTVQYIQKGVFNWFIAAWRFVSLWGTNPEVLFTVSPHCRSWSFHSRFISARLEKPVSLIFRDNAGCPRLPTVKVSLLLSMSWPSGVVRGGGSLMLSWPLWAIWIGQLTLVGNLDWPVYPCGQLP